MTCHVEYPCYVLVTPVRDEELYIRGTIESVISQTHLPSVYIIVNDGSTDRTGEIIEEYARSHVWIRTVHRQNRGFRKTGAGIIDAFYAGFNTIRLQNWQFLCKLDGDLTFGKTYFEKCFQQFNADPRLGIGGGSLYYMQRGKMIMETCPTFHVRGGVKIYRRSCWDEIGGLWVGPSSDTVDEVKAQMMGWTSRSFPDLLLEHHRPTGSAYGLWGASEKDGVGDYVCGYHPLFEFAKLLRRLLRKPYLVGSVAHLYGYLKGYAQKIPQIDDPQLIGYLRRQQLNRLFGRETIWR